MFIMLYILSYIVTLRINECTEYAKKTKMVAVTVRYIGPQDSEFNIYKVYIYIKRVKVYKTEFELMGELCLV